MSFLALIKKTVTTKLTCYKQKNLRLKILDACTNTDTNEKLKLRRLIKNGHSVAGYVPFIKGRCSYILYNFFSTNYGIRSHIDFIVAVFDGDGNIFNSRKELLGHRSVEWRSSEQDELNNYPEEGSLVIIAISKSLRANHALHGGHIRFWGMYDDSCIVHSMPFITTRGIYRLNSHRSYDRMMHSKNAYKALYSSFLNRCLHLQPKGDMSGSLKAPSLGYNILINSDNNVASIHHSSPYTRSQRLKEYAGKELDQGTFDNLIGIPPAKNLDAELFFGEAYESGSIARIFLEKKGINNTPIIVDVSDIKISNDTTVKLSSIFENFDSNEFLWIRIRPVSGKFHQSYVNITYINQNTMQPLDSTHAHCLAEQRKVRSRSLKFAPIIHEQKSEYSEYVKNSYIAIWGKSGFILPIKIRLRIFAVGDSSFEAIYNTWIENNAITYIDSKKLTQEYAMQFLEDKSYSSSSTIPLTRFLVQLESEEQNLNADTYILTQSVNKDLINMACDHLTGG